MINILITGADGLVGSAIKQLSTNYKQANFNFINRNKCDLTDRKQVNDIFADLKPDFVIHTAARVGGIGRNLNSPVQQFTDNILMNTNVLDMSHKYGVKKLIAFSSVCAFPASAEILKEEVLQDGPPYPAHMSYAYSKRMVDIHIQAYKQQYNSNFCSVIPGNIFGEFDNFNLEDGHVVPSIIHKTFKAKLENKPIIVWGDGSSTREFLYAKDVAEICLKLLFEIDELPLRLIVSGEEEITIKNLVNIIADVANYKNIEFDSTKPNGQKKRPSDHTNFKKLFPNFKFSDLNESLKNTYLWFEKNYDKARK